MSGVGVLRAFHSDVGRATRAMRSREGASAPHLRPLREQDGQMAVELAVLVPVVIVVALTVVNLMHFGELCSRFDRVAPDAVLAHGASPAGPPEGPQVVAAVRGAIESGMGDGPFEVEVRLEEGSTGSGGLIDLAAGSVRYVCILSYRPWPSSVEVAGVGYSAPAWVRHERSVTVDRYRAGVIT